MKKFALILITCILSVVCFTGCASKGLNLLSGVKDVVIGDDYYATAKMLGGASAIGYKLVEGNPKYDKYTAACRDIYNALDANDDTLTVGSINNVAIDMCRVALTAKYGYVYGALLTDGIIVGGRVADRIIAKRVDKVAAEQFLRGFKDGVDEELKNFPDTVAQPVEEKEKKAFDCKDGNCTIVVTNRSVKHQKAVAQQLIDEKWVKETDLPRENMPESDYTNVKDFVTRCEDLQKFGVKTTDMYIKEFKCKTVKGEDGEEVRSLEYIYIKMIIKDEETGKTAEFDVPCVHCTDSPEIPASK